jgi:hypothetical protein
MDESTEDLVKAGYAAARQRAMPGLPSHHEVVALLGRVRQAQRKQRIIAKAIRRLPSVVYAIKTDDGLVKIGYTSDLNGRLRKHGITRDKMDRLLFVFEGTIHDERELHHRFKAYLARGREYFHPGPELIAYINEQRERLGVDGVRTN